MNQLQNFTKGILKENPALVLEGAAAAGMLALVVDRVLALVEEGLAQGPQT